MRKVFVSRTCSRNTVAKLTYQMDDDAHRAWTIMQSKHFGLCEREKWGGEMATEAKKLELRKKNNGQKLHLAQHDTWDRANMGT